MNKYYGNVGFVETVEDPVKKIYKTVTTERAYFGEVLQRNYRWQSGSSINDDITVTNRISIISDPFILSNLPRIRYITWMNIKWKITSMEVQYPRIILEIGGEYNVEQD